MKAVLFTELESANYSAHQHLQVIFTHGIYSVDTLFFITSFLYWHDCSAKITPGRYLSPNANIYRLYG